MLYAACMMLGHVGHRETAQRIRLAVDLTLREDGIRTRDLKGTASTSGYASAVIAWL